MGDAESGILRILQFPRNVLECTAPRAAILLQIVHAPADGAFAPGKRIVKLIQALDLRNGITLQLMLTEDSGSLGENLLVGGFFRGAIAQRISTARAPAIGNLLFISDSAWQVIHQICSIVQVQYVPSRLSDESYTFPSCQEYTVYLHATQVTAISQRLLLCLL